ncbi:hypothetical protein [Bacillus sp. SM2101]|uniref:DUF7010 family protein n=1 Tax=Bacillus sp. SM2101 TaxID=2805366 RepID=UPI001BDEAADA|nr:hypothetical protein [Bacillus sp. SM2101]
MNSTLKEMQSELIVEAKKGLPFLLSGTIVFFIISLLPVIFAKEIIHFIWLFGLSSIFPLGFIISKILRINLLVTHNPIGILACIIAVPQAFYIPLYIIVYMLIPQYLPFTIGLLIGSHFLPYVWIYTSKAYLFITLSACLSSIIFGWIFIDYAFTVVPFANFIVYGVGALLILRELRVEFVY